MLVAGFASFRPALGLRSKAKRSVTHRLPAVRPVVALAETSHPAGEDAALWKKCPSCGEMLYRKDLEANLSVCTKCNYHFRMHAYDRINTLVDGDFVEIGNEFLPGDPLEWTDKRPYAQKLEADREKHHLPIGMSRRNLQGL